jgi:osmotically-inducible protein OsmY
MEPANPADIRATTQFANPAAANRNDLEWRIRACLRDRLPGLKGVIYVTAIGSTVAVRGTVNSPRDKRLCLDCCRHVPGVMRVVDDLVIDG